MTKEQILFTAIDRHFGSLQFQANLLSRMNNFDNLAGITPAGLIQLVARASEDTATEIRVWEREQLKKIANPEQL